MKIITYSQRDGFAEIEDGDIGLGWLDDETDLGAWLKRLGFSQAYESDGVFRDDEYERHTTVYTRQSSEWPILLMWNNVDEWEQFLVQNRADLWGLRSQLANVLMTTVLEHVCDMQKTITRAFRAWHGHDPEDPCKECDPMEVYHRKKSRERAEAKKAKEKQT